MSVLWTFLGVTAFVALLLMISLPSRESQKLDAFITRLLADGYFQLSPDDWLSQKGFKVVRDSCGAALYVQHDAFGFYVSFYSNEGDFQNEAYHAFTTKRDDDGVRSDLPSDCPESR